MKQLKVSLPDELRAEIEEAAAKAGHSLGEEIRQRLERTLQDDGIDPATRKLMAAIGDLHVLARSQPNHSWHQQPAAHRVFRHAIVARLARLRPTGEPVFAPGDLPDHPLVASQDVEAMGQGLE